MQYIAINCYKIAAQAVPNRPAVGQMPGALVRPVGQAVPCLHLASSYFCLAIYSNL